MTTLTTDMMTDYALPDSVLSRLRPPPRLSVSDWCDANRHLDSRFASEPGPWRTDRVPYLREIMDSFADPTVGSIIFVKCSRVGGTELLNNVIAYSAAARPMPMMYVLPTETDVADEFQGRIKSIFALSDTLRSHIPGGTWATSDQIALDSMTIYGGWASAPGTLIRKTCGLVLFDEVDNCQSAAGSLGNTWDLMSDRLTTYGYRAKQVGVTTPSTENASGWQLYSQSDRRRYFVPCPICGAYQVLEFGALKWPKDATPDEIEQDHLAKLSCRLCREEIPQAHQFPMISRGVWVPQSQQIKDKRPSDAAEAWRPALVGDYTRTRSRGYWINSLYSPWRSWSQCAAKFLLSKDDPERLRVFKNSWLAEPWVNAVESPEENWLHAKAGGLPAGVVPAGGKVIFLTIDVQGDYLYWTARAWGACGCSWLVDAGTAGNMAELWAKCFIDGWDVEDAPGSRMLAYAGAIDSGYRTDEVYEFVRSFKGMVAVKGFETRPKPVEKSGIDIRGSTDPLMIWLLHTSLFKTKLSRMMKLSAEAPGFWRLNSELPAAYLNHLTSEHFVETFDKQGRKKWAWKPKRIGRANHWLDCEVYQLALAEILEQEQELSVAGLSPGSPRLRMVTPSGAIRPEVSQPSQAPTPQPVQHRQQVRVTGGWQRR